MAGARRTHGSLTLETGEVEGGIAIRAEGRVDFETAPAFLTALREEAETLEDGAGLLVDLSGLVLITSAGLRALLRAKKDVEEKDGALVVAGARDAVAEAIRISSFDTLLTLAPTAEEGIGVLAAGGARETDG